MCRSFRLAAAMMMTMAASVQAETKPVTLDRLKQMVSDLGYKTYGDDKTYVAVDELTGDGGTVFFELENDGATLEIYKPFDMLTTEQMRNIPAPAMLKFNNEHAFYFTLGQAEGKDRVVLQELFDSNQVSPVFLRKQIDELKETVEAGKPLWDIGEWTKSTAGEDKSAAGDDKSAAREAGPGTPEAFQAQVAKADAIWEKTPFQLRNVMFVTEKAPVFGAYKPRGSNVFKADETIFIYCEPFGYAWQTTADAQNKFEVVIDFELMQGDKTLTGQKNAQSFNGVSRAKLTEFMANLYLNVKGLEPGKYAMRWTFNDKVGGKSAVAAMPFEIAK